MMNPQENSPPRIRDAAHLEDLLSAPTPRDLGGERSAYRESLAALTLARGRLARNRRAEAMQTSVLRPFLSSTMLPLPASR